MQTPILTEITNLGIAGFSIWIMWRLAQAFIQRSKEKDAEQSEERHSERTSFMDLVREQQTNFTESIKDKEATLREVETEFRTRVMEQLSENTKLLENTSKILDKAITVLQKQNVQENDN